MEAVWLQNHEKRRRWLALAVLIHLILGTFLLLPLLNYQEPPPEKQGVLVSFGEPETGQGAAESVPIQTEERKPVEAADEPEVAPKPTPTERSEPQKVLTQEEKSPIEVAEAKAKEQAKLEAQRKAAEEDARKRAEAARKKAAAEAEAKKQAEYEASKAAFGDLFSGKGESEKKAGSQGDPNGSENSDVLKGLSTGSGRVGGGLKDRGIAFTPEISENSQETGRVVIAICVDRNGNVVSARYTQRGSTTQSSVLKEKALNAARKYRFTEGKVDEQCGQVTFDFKVL